ncbi:hypothetical protein FLJC2902T_08910 [Flavobacterium limnosediminis JC2902]|uniref:Uncharacterized protein n=1 Tax=Flavobacterium limnosediminis JC2902 TaxID=1341181 RepID=V6SYI6_9FLAO|nr:hypothetical protein [Flavobacterium limnosediminis]ESU29485.1 hypothetical protein FLJC2902T_08910 [Flavobacterium limnosediminis JC2902]
MDNFNFTQPELEILGLTRCLEMGEEENGVSNLKRFLNDAVTSHLYKLSTTPETNNEMTETDFKALMKNIKILDNMFDYIEEARLSK